MSKKKNESAAGILLNTFGTILLLTVIIICALNFVKDGRGYQILAEKAAANVNDAAGSKKAEPKENAGLSQNGTAGSTSSKKSLNTSSKPAATKKTAVKTAQKPANKPADADTKDTAAGVKKPVQQGEEP